jgi:hypothetical protein
MSSEWKRTQVSVGGLTSLAEAEIHFIENADRLKHDGYEDKIARLIINLIFQKNW